MLKKTVSAFIALLGLSPFSADAHIHGNGIEKHEVRHVSAFAEVSVNNALHAEITVGPAWGVEVSGDENLIYLVRTEVQGQRLILEIEDHKDIERHLPFLVRITMPRLVEVTARGASHVAVRGRLADLRAETSSAARLVAKGFAALR